MVIRRALLPLGLVGAAVALVAASGPTALSAVSPGLWEISHSATGAAAQRRCLGDIAALAQGEQVGTSCTRVVLGSTPTSVTYHFTCADGGFGQSKISVITPRTVKVEAQGIAGGFPFQTVLHARRIGECRAGR